MQLDLAVVSAPPSVRHRPRISPIRLRKIIPNSLFGPAVPGRVDRGTNYIVCAFNEFRNCSILLEPQVTAGRKACGLGSSA
ncbi:hypothetical protein [Saccharopolyspora sp. 5N708]|uniref:hypothetical protein n=1 Tax=Saccharopolyspora sp. 5N708 TaxID=3457424 RepID=UPI003FCF682D